MKKVVFGFVTMFAIAMTATVYAETTNSAEKHPNHDETCEVGMTRNRCNGTVGCSCSGFAPITNGDVWQESYCRRCSHHKRYHK